MPSLLARFCFPLTLIQPQEDGSDVSTDRLGADGLEPKELIDAGFGRTGAGGEAKGEDAADEGFIGPFEDC